MAINNFFDWFRNVSWGPESVTAAGTVALAILTLVLAIGTLFLWLSTRRLVKDAKENAIHQLRGYVFPEIVEIANTAVAPIITAIFKNCGATPVYDIVLWSTAGAADYSLDEIRAPGGGATESCGHLGPGMSIHTQVRADVTSVDVARLRNSDTAALFFAGALSYRDAFGKSRTTKFCYFRGRQGPDGRYADGPMTVYHRWNDAD